MEYDAREVHQAFIHTVFTVEKELELKRILGKEYKSKVIFLNLNPAWEISRECGILDVSSCRVREISIDHILSLEARCIVERKLRRSNLVLICTCGEEVLIMSRTELIEKLSKYDSPKN